MSATCCHLASGVWRCKSSAAFAVLLVVGNDEHTLTNWQITQDRTQLLAVCSEHMKVDPNLVAPLLRELVAKFREKTKSLPLADLCGVILKPIDCDEARAAFRAITGCDPVLSEPEAVPIEVVREKDLGPQERAALRGALPCVSCGKYPEVEAHADGCTYRKSP